MRGRPAKAPKLLQCLWYVRGGIFERVRSWSAEEIASASHLEGLGARYREMAGRAPAPGSALRLVSVVIPVFYRESRQKFLTALSSILDNETAVPIEIVIVLNGKASTRELRECELSRLAETIGARTVLLSYDESEAFRDIARPRNIFVARQAGLEASRGDVVVAVDIDCLFARGWIAAYAEAFEASPELLLAYGPVGFHRIKGAFGRIMSWLSVLARAAKILGDFPPYYGANHAMRRVVATMIPGMYSQRITVHENEIPRILARLLEPGQRARFIRCVPGAVTRADLSGLRQSFTGLFLWMYQSARKNLRQVRMLRSAGRQ